MSNARYASAPRMGGAIPPAEPYTTNRSLTPNRLSMYDRTAVATQHDNMEAPHNYELGTPSSSGLIRLCLKKPMGIVFEPMYDPLQKSLQRGVRICDLPRTGAAALSRQLQVGDELLQINDKTVSRLNFDQIMDFIIEADPDRVNLLFRRPRRETLQARQQSGLVSVPPHGTASRDAPATVKWDVEDTKEKKKSSADKKVKRTNDKKGKRTKKGSVSEEDDGETLHSSTAEENESYVKPKGGRKKKSKKDPYESESFLDLLIDTICSNSNNICRDTFRRTEDEYFSDDEESFATDAEDESTYVTYEESLEPRAAKSKRLKQRLEQQQRAAAETDTEDDTRAVEEERRLKRLSKEKAEKKASPKKAYVDDGTLETSESEDRVKQQKAAAKQHEPFVLADPITLQLAPITNSQQSLKPVLMNPGIDEGIPAPIREVAYDEGIDHGADVSVMESLGGPSLLIEKQRAALQAVNQKQKVPADVVENFGLDYPANYGSSRDATIQENPLKFYTHVVKGLLERHEPEKVRLLDKLLAKYKGREDHLVQKLSVRYDRPAESGLADGGDAAFTDAVQKGKMTSTAAAAAAVHTAKERMQNSQQPFEVDSSGQQQQQQQQQQHEWPEKETKEQEPGDGDETESGSDYSRESVDGTSPAVIAQVSELLNYVYGKTSVPGQIDRVSTIMRAYEGREAVLLELLETKALIKANKEKENSDTLPSFLRHPQHAAHAQKNANEGNVTNNDLPPVTPMATQLLTDDMSSMSGVSSPAREHDLEPSGILNQTYETEEVEVTHHRSIDFDSPKGSPQFIRAPAVSTSRTSNSQKPLATPVAVADKKKKKGLFGVLFGGKKKKDSATPASKTGSRVSRKLK
jgi:hypothetical protein